MKQLRFEEALPDTGAVLDVYVKVGHVEIRPHDGRAVVVEAEVEHATVTVEAKAGTVYVVAEPDEAHKKRSLLGQLLGDQEQSRIRLFIYVPADCEIRAKTVTGTQQIQGIVAPVTSRITTGKAFLSELSGPIYAKLVTGNILYEGNLANVDHRLETVTGNIQLRLHEEPAARLDVRVATGHAGCKFPLNEEKQTRHLVGGHLRGVLGSGKGQITAKIVTGNFQIQPA